MNAKLLAVTLALGALLFYVYPCAALEEEKAAESVTLEAATLVVNLEGADGGANKVLIASADPDVPTRLLVKGEAVGSELKICTDPNRGWLGVLLAEVPPALAEQLPSSEGGLLITNIVRDSPAEEAGLQKFDIITEMNGEGISGGVAGLAKALGVAEPGAEVTLKILRSGKELTVNATLAKRAQHEKLDWIHEFAPDVLTRETIKTQGKILSKDEDGSWRLEDLGDLSEMQNLPDEIRKLLPGRDTMTINVFADENQESINCIVMRDGETISIAQEDGGEIIVKRTDGDGQESEETYADAEALKEADAEAYEIYEQATSGAHAYIQIGPGDADMHIWAGDEGAKFDFPGHQEWKVQIESAIKEAHKAVEEANKSMDEAHKHMRFKFKGWPAHPFFQHDDEEPSVFSFGFDVVKTTRSFRVNPDGEIEVIIRKGDSEVTKVFRDESDLQQRDPDLHEEYEKVTADE